MKVQYQSAGSSDLIPQKTRSFCSSLLDGDLDFPIPPEAMPSNIEMGKS